MGEIHDHAGEKASLGRAQEEANIGGGLEVMGPSGLVMPSLVIGIAAALLWFSWFARSRGWFGQVLTTVERE